MTGSGKPALLKAPAGEAVKRPPVWVMRQAGRFLSEDPTVRAIPPDYISFCGDAVKAAQAIVRSIQRFGFDGAIGFVESPSAPTTPGQVTARALAFSNSDLAERYLEGLEAATAGFSAMHVLKSLKALQIFEFWAGVRYILNLGHSMFCDTSLAHVAVPRDHLRGLESAQ